MGWDSSDSILSVKDKAFLNDVDLWMDPLKIAQIQSDQSGQYWTVPEDDVALGTNPFPRANPPYSVAQ